MHGNPPLLDMENLLYLQARRRGGQEGAGAPPAFQFGDQGGSKVPFLDALICFLIVNTIFDWKRQSFI